MNPPPNPNPGTPRPVIQEQLRRQHGAHSDEAELEELREVARLGAGCG